MWFVIEIGMAILFLVGSNLGEAVFLCFSEKSAKVGKPTDMCQFAEPNRDRKTETEPNQSETHYCILLIHPIFTMIYRLTSFLFLISTYIKKKWPG